MSENAHALLGASSAHRWGKCMASLRMERDAPRRSSKDASEGTAAHTLGAWALQNDAHPKDYPEPTIEADGQHWPVTQEMIDNIATYVAAARADAEGGTLLVEQKVTYGPLIFGDELMGFPSVDPLTGEPTTVVVDPKEVGWGTSDLIALLIEEIRIRDYKNGGNPHNAVSAEDNEQMMLYLLGALYEYGMLGDFKRGKMAISQPRLKHAPEHTVTIEDLMVFAKRIGEAGRRALELYFRKEEPALEDFTPGSACKWCSRKATCPALLADVTQDTRDLFAGMVAAEIPDDILAQAMSQVDKWEWASKAVRAEVERRLLVGQPVAGYKLVEGRRGARKWTSDDEAEQALKSFRLKVEEMYDFTVISPTKAEKVLKESPRRWAKLQSLIGRSDGKPSVAPESDKRPALAVTSMTDAFASLAAPSEEV